MDRYGLNPCGEIIGRDFHCNLSEVHLNTLDPGDHEAQADAFYAAGLQVAALLQHEFAQERYQYSREIDPIVGVSFTGLFDFFVHAGGQPWLEWMMGGRKNGRARDVFEAMERNFLQRWRRHAHFGVRHYCSKHNIRVPNRITTVQPAGTKSLLTGASSGWHPPKSQRFIRRITLGIKDPLVESLHDYGYNIIPAQSAKDEDGNLLDDIKDPRVQEVLVEIPTEVSWANIPGCDEFDLNKLPVESQWGLYMQVQNNYTDHNTSATIEIRQEEVPVLAKLIYENIEKYGGYISAALLARFDANETFPRLPFEPITKDEYEQMKKKRQKLKVDNSDTLLEILEKYDSSNWAVESVNGCANEACIAKADAAEREGKL
jgi:ribonucleotide reductase class II